MSMREVALDYIARGFKVLACATIVDGHCGCPEYKTSRICRDSPGKHPLFRLSPNGAYSATDDPEVVSQWPEDGYNVGIAGQALRPIIDIDEPDVAQAILALPGIGRNELVAVTGREGGGCHIYIACESETKGSNLRSTEGRVLGEVRAHGLYVVAPPSTHLTGRQYRWVRAPGDAPETVHPGDGLTYARSLLKRVGVELRGARVPRTKKQAVDERGFPITQEEADEAPLEAIECPFLPDYVCGVDLRQLLSGTMPVTSEEGRSGTLFQLACELYRQAAVVNYPITPREVAGVVKELDARSYRKFADRGSAADARYWQLALDAQEDSEGDVNKIVAKAAPPAERDIARDADFEDWVLGGDEDEPEGLGDGHDGAAGNDHPEYPYSETDGLIWRKRISRGVVNVSLCGFEVSVPECLNVWRGSDEEAYQEWVFEAKQGGEVIHIRLTDTDRQSGTAFRQRVSRALPPHFIVEPEQWDRLFTAALKRSKGRTIVRESYEATGWVRDRDLFLLPNLPGAIGPDGIDTSVRFSMPEKAPSLLRQYGKNMEDNPEGVLPGLQALYRAAEPHIIVPVLAQAFAAPLLSLGTGEERTIVHLLAKSGSHKTTIMRGVASLYGLFITGNIASWTSTVNSLHIPLHYARDLPVLIDDYKLKSLSRDGVTQVIRLIQNYADGTTRGRMGRDQSEQRSLVSASNILSTGEDVWESQESTMARTVVVTAAPGTMEGGLTLKRAVAEGWVGAVGFAWIKWLARQGQERLRKEILRLHVRNLEAAEKHAIGQEHDRIVAAVAMLITVDELFHRFVREVCPAFLDEYKGIRAEGWRASLDRTAEQASEARGLAPFAAIMGVITSAVATEKGRFLGRRHSDDNYGYAVAPDIVGYVDDEWVYLTNNETWAYIERYYSQRGQQPPCAWTSFKKDAVQTAAGEAASGTVKWWCQPLGRVLANSVRVPRSTVWGSDNA